MKHKALGLAGLAVALCSLPAFAHHSFSMFDADKNLTIEGTIKEFQWTNPHTWILMMVQNADGQPEQWSIEMSAPGTLLKQGWLPKTLTPGMKVSATIHPLRDGSHGGQFSTITLPDGKTMGKPAPGGAAATE
jgi:hypothetical protein